MARQVGSALLKNYKEKDNYIYTESTYTQEMGLSIPGSSERVSNKGKHKERRKHS
jgi:hypothetical protein